MRINPFIKDPANADLIRFLQDQPIAYHSRFVDGLRPDYNFPNRLANFLEEIGILTEKQIAAGRHIMTQKQWIEPPRFKPFAQVKLIGGEYKYVVTVCPGAIPKREEVQHFVDEVQILEIPAYFDIGPLIETTHDGDDPRLSPMSLVDIKKGKRARYKTICHQLLTRAKWAGSEIIPPAGNKLLLSD
jgi:hypothetical protein